MDPTMSEEQEPVQAVENHGDDRLRPRIEELKERLVSLNERTKELIKEHPAACLMGALGLGYLCARIARRGTR